MSYAETIRSVSTPEPQYYSLQSHSLLSNLPYQREKIARKQGAALTIMLAGESGLGKATFIRSLFGSEFTTTKRHAMQDKGQKYERSDIHRTAELEVHQTILLENEFETKLTVIHTPGFGDYTNNMHSWVPLANYIDAQHQFYMCQHEQLDRSKLLDTRVHACLFFLPPTNRISMLDLTAMSELSTRVNVIPVIAKADSMTREDLATFKQVLREVIAGQSIDCWYPSNIPAIDEKWPLGITASDEVVTLPDGTQTYGREYRWGILDINNPNHSDFVLTRDTIFGQNLLNLIDVTAQKYYARQRRYLRLTRLKYALNMKRDSSMPDQTASPKTTDANFDDEADPRRKHKLNPQDRASINYTRHAAQNNSASSLDFVEEVAATMKGLEILSSISDAGYTFLRSEFHEHDAVFRQRVIALKSQFELVVKFQEDRFDQQATELEHTRDRLSREINALNEANVELATQVREMETRKRK